MIGLAFLLAVAQQSVQRVEIPVSELNVSDIGFVCGVGMATVTIEHHGVNGVVDFGQSWGTNPFIFELRNAVRSVVHEQDAQEERWLIRAEGRAEHTTGLAPGSPASINLTIRRSSNGRMQGDFAVRAGRFSRTEANCMTMPPRLSRPQR